MPRTDVLLFVSVEVQVDGKPIRVELCDTAGEVSLTALFAFSFFGPASRYRNWFWWRVVETSWNLNVAGSH